MGSSGRRPLYAIVVAAVCVAALVPGRSVVRAYSAPVDAQLAEQLRSPLTTVGAFVHFAKTTPFLDGVARVTSSGLTVGDRFHSANAVYAYGLPASFDNLRADAHVARLEFPRTLPLSLQTATWATRARSLDQETAGLDLRVPAPGGGYVNGTGSGIAVIDTGIDGSHPDLDWCGNGPAGTCKTVLNFKVACTVQMLGEGGSGPVCAGPTLIQDVEDSDTTSGHGTHVAGIAAGTGAKSDGLYRGVASGAKLYGFGTGEGNGVLTVNAAAAFQWIIDHHEDPLGNGTAPVAGAPADPPIVVINNSYGGVGEHRPDFILSKLANAAIAEGITVVWGAGNEGGTGASDDCADVLLEPIPCTGDEASNPTPGNISVANYDDGGEGRTDNVLSETSSRGDATRPETWPDISAPGSLIVSTCKPMGLSCAPLVTGYYPPYYDVLSGTSMAAPHVTGIVALLHQADPSIAPGDIEDVLQDTAHKFTAGAAYVSDPQNTDGTSSFDKGAGLADARLAVLRTVGLPENLGVTLSGEVAIDTPVDGSTVTPAFLVSGTAVAPSAAAASMTDETGSIDAILPSTDFQTMRISEPGPGLLEVRYSVAAAALAPPLTHEFDLLFGSNAAGGALALTWDPSTGALGCFRIVFEVLFIDDTKVPIPGCVATHVPGSNTFSLTFPAAAIGASRGSALFALKATSRVGVLGLEALRVQDTVPGGPDVLNAFPEAATPYVLTGGDTASVTLSLDGVDPVTAGSGAGTFAWSAPVGPLASGTHTLTARLLIGSTEVASDTATATVPSLLAPKRRGPKT